jgi:hypothetical protein
VKAQNKQYGLLIDDIAGIHVYWTRAAAGVPVQPLVVYKVFADGRPDELRGVDIVERRWQR